MTDEADRLNRKLTGLLGLSGQAIAEKIVTELGITEKMVEATKVSAVDSFEGGYEDHGRDMASVATALSTLLEVAGA